MKDYANIFWFIFGGFAVVALWALLGLVLCATVVGIPLGKDLFRCARFSMAPFGKAPQSTTSKHPAIDIVWLIIGIPLVIFFIFLGLAYTVTLIGIPFGKQCYKMVVLAMSPFNIDFEDEETSNLPPREEY